jgi:hypothetical protein
MAAIGAILSANSTLNAEVATTINAMAQTMPTRAQIFPNGPGGAPNKAFVAVISDPLPADVVVTRVGQSGPNGPMSTTSGGSSSLDDTLKKITDNVDRTVEQKQVNPTPTGI